jgi:hypothetical protein
MDENYIDFGLWLKRLGKVRKIVFCIVFALPEVIGWGEASLGLFCIT